MTPSSFILVKPGTINRPNKKRLRGIGVEVIEHPEPSTVLIQSLLPPTDSTELLRKALAVISKNFSASSDLGSVLVAELVTNYQAGTKK